MRIISALLRVSLAAGAAVGLASAAHASDGTITFNGQITSVTCTINSGTPSFSVTLPAVNTTALPAANSTAGRTPFAITLSGCGAATGNVAAYFEPGSGTNSTTHLLNNTGTATGVGVELLNSNSAVIQLGNSYATQAGSTATLASGGATLNYFAQYKATAAAGAGTVVASTTYLIVYG